MQKIPGLEKIMPIFHLQKVAAVDDFCCNTPSFPFLALDLRFRKL